MCHADCVKEPPASKRRGSFAVQMEFGEVVELEPIAGDPEYTAWLAAGRPRSSGRNLDEAPDAGDRE